MPESRPLERVIDDLEQAAGSGEVSVGHLIAAFEDRSLGVLITLLGFLALVPVVGGLPGAPVAIAFLLLAAVAQSFLGRGGIWAPGVLRRRRIGTERLRRALDAARPWAERIDSLTGQRLEFLVASRPARLVMIACVAALAVSLLPLGLIPAGIAPAAAAITLFGLALTSRDGLLALVGYGFAAAAVWVGLMIL